MSDHGALDPHLHWDEAGAPRSGRFGDIYFSAEDGLAESRAVFLEGCGLPDAWRGRSRFVVGELGFGSGLNVAALIGLWRQAAPSGAVLQVFSVEAYPMTRDEAARALARWPELEAVTRLLLARWPQRAPGVQRIDLPELGCTIDLATTEAVAALSAWSGRADAWFLDGFSPASNPQMWREEVIDLVAARSQPGARLATFTVAGEVRRRLAGAGFEVEKRQGFGRKRERLQARFVGTPGPTQRLPQVAVVGAGIAGAAVARALRRLGVEPRIYEAHAPGSGASGNAAALVTPRLDAGGGAVAGFSAQAFLRAVEIYSREAPEALLAQGVLQLENQPRDSGRFDRVAAQALWPEGALVRLGAEQISARLGEPVARGGLQITSALVVDPRAVFFAWLTDCRVETALVVSLERSGGLWRLMGAGGRLIDEVDVVVVCAGAQAGELVPKLPLSFVRGQVTTIDGMAAPAALAWGGYLAPTAAGLMVGATHDRSDASSECRPGDDGRNFASLDAVLPRLAVALRGAASASRASVRCVSPDRLPVTGEVQQGLFVLAALGSRGFCTAPLLAEHLAARVLDAPSPLPMQFAEMVSPGRFGARTVRPTSGLSVTSVSKET